MVLVRKVLPCEGRNSDLTSNLSWSLAKGNWPELKEIIVKLGQYWCCGLGVVKHRPDSILRCRTVTGVRSDGFAIIISQPFYHLVCDTPLPPHPHTLSPLIHKPLLPSLLVPYTFFFAHAPHIHACSLGWTHHRASDH